MFNINSNRCKRYENKLFNSKWDYKTLVGIQRYIWHIVKKESYIEKIVHSVLARVI